MITIIFKDDEIEKINEWFKKHCEENIDKYGDGYYKTPRHWLTFCASAPPRAGRICRYV